MMGERSPKANVRSTLGASMYVSLKDVAARAGVSFQTASKVLNGHPGVVSDRTRGRILKAAKDIGYVPNALARGLVRQTSLTVGVLIDDVTDPALSQFILAAERTASTQGHAVLIVAVEPGMDPALAVRKMQEHRVGGILVIAPSLEEDPRLGVALRGPLPAVSVNHVHGGGIPLVGSDHAATGTIAAEHLLGLGHDRFATVTGPRGRRVVRSRHDGFRRRIQEAGLRLSSRLVTEADWTLTGAFAAANRLLDADSGFTALFVHNDVMAVGVLHALRVRGRRVPQDCSVVSCDDLDFAPFLAPPLTTVHVPFQETGEQAAMLLLRMIKGDTAPDRFFVPTHLVVRDSTATLATGLPMAIRTGGTHRPLEQEGDT
jgi:LacI family transcriptional regulator